MALASVAFPSPSKVEGSWSAQLASSHQRWTMLKKRHAHSPRRWNAAYQPLRTWVCYDGTVWIDSPKGRTQATCGWSLFIPLSQIVNASVCTDGTHACYLRSCHVYFSMNSHWSMRLHLSLPLFNLFFPSYYIIISFLLRYLLLPYCMKLWSCK